MVMARLSAGDRSRIVRWLQGKATLAGMGRLSSPAPLAEIQGLLEENDACRALLSDLEAERDGRLTGGERDLLSFLINVRLPDSLSEERAVLTSIVLKLDLSVGLGDLED